MRYQLGTESIGRVDFAMDFFAPDFVLIPDHFVMHARCNRSDHTELEEIATNGHSGRVTSVTIGKNPGRQVIVYDKRAEVISQRKPYWWPIWDATRTEAGWPALDQTDRKLSQIWRLELRAHKHHLKNGWNITTWGDLRLALPQVLKSALNDIRYATPTADRNRARWPDSQLWRSARREVVQLPEDIRSMADPALIREQLRAEQNALLVKQTRGLLIAIAGLNGTDQACLVDFLAATQTELLLHISNHPEQMNEKLRRARERYAGYR
jgi:hypothetical protein